MIAELSEKQEAVRALINGMRSGTDRSFTEAVIGSFEDDEALIAVTLVMNELSHDPEREPTENDLIWSIEFLDHLDTLGKKIVAK